MLLDNMRVVSFCHYLQGPAATQYLADLGADVIKIEPPRGAFERHWSGGRSYVDGTSAFHLAVNRNKRSLSLDLKHPDSIGIVRRLIQDMDVLVENFRPGVLDRLGLGYEAVRAWKPAIIYASATAYGASGPLRDRPGQDLLMQARSGLIAVTGNRESGPVNVGAAIVDQHGAALLAMAILAAFNRRNATGQGARIESSLFNAGIDLQTEALTKYMASPYGREALDRDRHVGSWYHDAPYGVYRLEDAHIVLSMNDPAKLAAALDSAELRAVEAIDRYAERDRYARLVAGLLRSRRFADIAPVFDREGIWYERVQDYEDLQQDPQVLHNRTFVEIPVGDATARLVNHPVRYDGALPPVRRTPPRIGEHSREILTELGYSEAEVARLVEAGAVVDGAA